MYLLGSMNLRKISDKVKGNLLGRMTGSAFQYDPSKAQAQSFQSKVTGGVSKVVKCGAMNVKGTKCLAAQINMPDVIHLDDGTVVALMGCFEKDNKLYACYRPENGWEKGSAADKLTE